MNDVDYIMSMLPSYYDFDRMIANHQAGSFETYDDFIEHNHKIINDLPADDLAFLRRLCGMIKTTRVNLMDLESCVEFQSDGIYYNSNGDLCIFNPR
jgi:hypothetical protein